LFVGVSLLYVVVGPPAAGKSTWVLERATPADLVIDYDRLATALTGAGADPHNPQPVVETATAQIRKVAVRVAVRYADLVDVYVIHSIPNRDTMKWYRSLGADIVVIDPGQETVMDRCVQHRPSRALDAVHDWYQEYAEP
jgi:hypothetical protein